MKPQEHYKTLVAYCEMKVAQCDWHGVSDAANDLRELLARFPSIKQPEMYVTHFEVLNGTHTSVISPA